MKYLNYKQRYAVEKRNKERWLGVDSKLNENSGIYILTRLDENGIKYAYVGQAKHILTRLAQHLSGYQHIDLSLKKHGLYSNANSYGWTVHIRECAESELDEKEQYYIMVYANMGFQLRNKTTGSQGVGKVAIETKTPKGYYDGKKQGWKDARVYVGKLFKANLKAVINGNDGARKQQALQKFNEFIDIKEEE